MINNHWHIAGRGAIGLLWAYHWRCSDLHVTLLDHRLEEKNDPLSTNQFTIDKLNGDSDSFDCDVSPLMLPKQDGPDIQNLLLPLKAFDIKTVLTQLQPRLSDTATIMLCHNGMGTLDEVLPLLKSKQNLYFASTTHGAFRHNRSHVVHSGLGQTQIGVIKSTQTQPNDSISKGLTPIQWQSDINQVLWNKLAINCVINPLTAINNCKNGALADNSYRNIILQLCDEFSQVALACDIQLQQKELVQRVYQVIDATAQNFSSMQQDIVHGRQSEIEYITGYLIKKAQQHHIAVPQHQALYRQINEMALLAD